MTLFTSPVYAAVTASGLAENFDASLGANTTTLWENQVGSRDLESGSAITLTSVISAGTTITDAYRFDGTAGFQDSAGNVFGSLDNSNSFEIWFRPDALTGSVLFESGGATGMNIRIDGSGNLFAFAEGDELTYGLNFANLGYDPTSDFTQLVFTADSANPGGTGAKLYVNGQLVTEGAAANWNGTGNHDGLGVVSGSGTAGEQLGGTPNFDGVPTFDGDIAIFRIYDDILTSTEVSDNYNAFVIPEPSSAVLIGFSGLALIARRRCRD